MEAPTPDHRSTDQAWAGGFSQSQLYSEYIRQSFLIQIKNIVIRTSIIIAGISGLISLVSGSLEAGLVTLATLFLAATWPIGIFFAFKSGEIKGVQDFEAVILPISKTDYQIDHLIFHYRKYHIIKLTLALCIFTFIIFTPLYPMNVILVAIPLYFFRMKEIFLEKIRTISPAHIDKTSDMMKDQAQKALLQATAPIRTAAGYGVNTASQAFHSATQRTPARLPLNVFVDTVAKQLFVGTSSIGTDRILAATLLVKKSQSHLPEIASAAGFTAFGPLGGLLGGFARKAGLGHSVRFALKLTIDDEHNPIRVLEITVDPLPLNSPLCQQTRERLDKTVAQLLILRARRDQSRTS